jgi:hypothetical protein
LIVLAGPAKQHRIVVSRGGVAGPEPERDFKLLTRLTEASGTQKKVGQ